MTPKRLVVVLAVLAVVGALVFYLTQSGRIDQNAAKNDCWSAVLDTIVKDTGGLVHPVAPHDREMLVHEARACVKLP